MISLTNISIAFGGRDLLREVSFQINPKDKIGLVGRNGSGKSTLLKLIVGEIKDFSGNVSVPKGLTIGYLPQYIEYSDTRTVFQEAFTAFDQYRILSKQLDELNNQLADRVDFESSDYQRLLDKISELSDKLSLHNESTFVAKTEKILKGLGFVQEDFDKPTSIFSGGWRIRVEIAKILLKEPDVLLLDEPTNHLDIESIQWLEDFLKTFNGAIVIISHDKLFLDNITNRTIEISLANIYDYPVYYSKFKELRKIRREQQQAAFENQQQKIKSTEKFIERFRAKATKASQVQSRIKMLDKLEEIEFEEEDNSTLNFVFPPAPRSGDIVVNAEALSKSYGDKLVLDEIDITIERGEKIAFVGKNGEGKTTLVRVLNNETDYSGKLKIGHNVKIGYFAQNQEQNLDMQNTVLETLDRIAVGEVRTQLRKILGAFLFRDEDVDKKVAILSGGEKARLALATLILQPYNLLILDEPTNHLDISAKEILKQALQKYDGTLILVSHDRYFLDGLVDTVYEFKNHKIKQYKGGISYFLEKKRIKNLEELTKNQQVKTKTEQNKIKDSKQNYLKRKERKRQLERFEKVIAQIEDKIQELENEILEMEEKMSKPENLVDSNIFENYEKTKQLLESAIEEWETTSEQYEALKKEELE